MYTLKRPSDIKNIELQTEENCFMSIAKSNGEYIKYVLEPSDNLIKLALRINGQNIRFLDPAKQTKELCMFAAIHGATENMLEVVDDDVLLAIKVVEEYAADVRPHRMVRNICINGEMTNLRNTFHTDLIKDMPEYLSYAIENSMEVRKSFRGQVTIGDGKLYNFDLGHIIEGEAMLQKVEEEAS